MDQLLGSVYEPDIGQGQGLGSGSQGQGLGSGSQGHDHLSIEKRVFSFSQQSEGSINTPCVHGLSTCNTNVNTNCVDASADTDAGRSTTFIGVIG